MAEVLRPDICVIGAGSGGLTVAAAAAAFGVPVVLIEKGKMGSDCLNTGCLSTNRTISPNPICGLRHLRENCGTLWHLCNHAVGIRGLK